MPFQPGQSGNPSGRPRVAEEVKALARVHTTEAVETLVQVMRDGGPRDRVAAATALLDRGYGKPAQIVGGDPEGAPIKIEEIVRRIVDPAD